MEYAKAANAFEDHSTIAMMNRNLPVPQFTQNTNGGVLTIKTSSISLSYTLGQAFSPSSLSVASLDSTSAFKGWTFGQAFPGNLLGTIRGLDGQDNTPLNCTQNVGILDNGELNRELGTCCSLHVMHCATVSALAPPPPRLADCEWGMVSRDGWVVYDDTQNYILDANDWWVPTGGPPPPRSCAAGTAGTDASSPVRAAEFPDGIKVRDPVQPVALCLTGLLTLPSCVLITGRFCGRLLQCVLWRCRLHILGVRHAGGQPELLASR
jgi:hypothetical protein